MRKLICIVLTIMLGMMGGMGVDSVRAADGQGRARVAADDDGRKLSFDALTAVSNSGVLEKKNGITTRMIVAFTNSGNGEVDIWIQHAQAQEVDGGVFVNATSSAITFDSEDNDTYVDASSTTLLPFVRAHTEDSDITTNNTQVNVWAW